MIKQLSSKNQCTQTMENYMSKLQFFSNTASQILDDAEIKLNNLFDTLDQASLQKYQNGELRSIYLSSEKVKNSQKTENQLRTERYGENSNLLGNSEGSKYWKLLKRKQSLMQKLQQVEQQLIKSKYQSLTCRSTQMINNQQKDSKSKPKLNPLKSPQKILKIDKNINEFQKNYDRIEEINKGKIKYHEELIKRMKIRQEEQIKKIQQIEERRTKHQIKRQKLKIENKENLQAIELPKIKKLIS